MAVSLAPSPPGVVVKGFSTDQEVQSGMVGLDDALAPERDWYAEAPRFADHLAIIGAVAAGALVEVTPDANVKPIGRFRNSELCGIYPPYLTPNALLCMQGVGRAWRSVADAVGVPDSVRLAATSLTRSQEYQDGLVRAGKFAVKDSTHVTGNAFDIDLGGYSEDLADGTEVLTSLRPPARQKPIAEALQAGLKRNVYEPVRLGPEYYDPRVTDALLYVVAILHEQGFLNAVPEMTSTVNGVLHIAAASGLDGFCLDRAVNSIALRRNGTSAVQSHSYLFRTGLHR
jgi:hypothetical protein